MIRRIWNRGALEREDGMVSAEYAVGILAAIAFALVLLAIMKSEAVRNAITSIVTGGLASV